MGACSEKGGIIGYAHHMQIAYAVFRTRQNAEQEVRRVE